MTTILLHAVPENQRTRVCDQIRLVNRQHMTQVTQVMKLADFLERRLSRTVYSKRESRPVTELAEENDLLFPQVGTGGMPIEKNRMEGFF
jgi:hypothetical protein